MSWGSVEFFTFFSQACMRTHRPHNFHIPTQSLSKIPEYKLTGYTCLGKKACTLDAFLATHCFDYRLHSLTTTVTTLGGLTKHLLAYLPRMKGPALLALVPDIPGHCSLLALPDVSPAPLSDKRRLDIVEFYIKLWTR